MSAPTTVAEVLEQAADRIEERGWTQGAYLRTDGTCCARGAIRLTLGGEVGENFDEDKLYVSDGGDFECDVIWTLHHELDTSLMEWNDDPERTADEVIALLREVAAAERAS